MVTVATFEMLRWLLVPGQGASEQLGELRVEVVHGVVRNAADRIDMADYDYAEAIPVMFRYELVHLLTHISTHFQVLRTSSTIIPKDANHIMEPQVHSVFEPVTGTWQYLVADGIQHQAAIIDSVLDYDKETGTLKTNSADSLLKLAEEKGYTITHILETHVHADHLTASRYLQNVLGQRWAEYRPLVGIGERVSHVQATLGPIYGIPEPQMKGAFDRTFADDEKFQIGDLTAKVIHLPGHTPDHIGYVVGSNIFTGDSLFNPDVGSARCDFPGGDANALYASAAKLFSHPDHYRLYTGHDYPPPTRELTSDNKKPQPVPFTTVGQQKIENKHLKDGTEKAEFVKWRTERDSTLSTPRLMSAAMNVNLRGGKVPLSLGGASEVTFDERSMPEHLARI